MSMDDLYEEMKAALKYFELHFSAKDQVQIYVCDGRLYFAYDTKEISIELEEDIL